MIAVLVLAVLLVGMAIGYEYWLAMDNDLPFAYESFSEFGYIIHTYMPGFEKLLANSFSREDQVHYISPVFQTPTVIIVAIFAGMIVGFTLLSKVIEWKRNGGELFGGLFSGRSKYARHKDNSKGRVKYKRR
ncbi:MAG: hypothetical protein AB7E85_04880 [Pseudobdellovibrionaceae bacterium]